MKAVIEESSGVAEIMGPVFRPDAGSLVTRPKASDWEQEESTGFSYKTLFEDRQTGQKTILMKVAAGVVAAPHFHDQLEQVLVLEGEFYDECETYGPGDFVIRAPGALHTGGSKDGALVLLIYSE